MRKWGIRAAILVLGVASAVVSGFVWLRRRVRADWGYDDVQYDQYPSELHRSASGTSVVDNT